MTGFTRREFLRRLASGGAALAGGWLLIACGAREQAGPATSQSPSRSLATPLPNQAQPPAPSPTLVAGETQTSGMAPSSPYPHLVVARGGDPEEMVRRALAALGGMERFVSAGDNVIVKPNICVAYHSYEYAATTNPWVVAGLVRLALEAGARRVRVMDYPFGGSAEEAYARSGIQEQVLAAGGEMEVMSRFKFVKTDIPQGLDIQRCDIYDDILNADVVINVPIAKHHSLARLTLGMKNLLGVVRDRPAMHRNLGQRLADLTSRVQPRLTVVDAVRILMDHGPTGGDLDDVKQLNTVIVSPDIVAADSYAATLFGLQPQDLSYIQAATAMGLGRSDLGGLKIEELSLGG
ncbi:MAG: DUF362 domain-containing protein [Anaerolineae bacterium]